MTNRTRVVVATAGAGALAIGGLVAKRVIGGGRGGDDEGKGASADPIAETPTAPPGAEEKPVPKPKPAKPKAPKAKADKPKADKGEAEKPKPVKAATPKPEPKDKPAPKPKPVKPKAAKPAKPAGGKGPHAELNNPVVDDPDLTEYPDPYDSREDPRDPVGPDDTPFGEEIHPATGAESTSEPPLQQDPEVENGGKPPRRDKLDD